MDDCIREDAMILAKLAECWDSGTQLLDTPGSSSDSAESQFEETNPLYVAVFAAKLQAAGQIEQLLVSPLLLRPYEP